MTEGAPRYTRRQSRTERMAIDSSRLRGLLSPGTMVEHFRVLRLLGQGGMADVYLARDTKLGRRVALKRIRPDVATAADHERFLFEATTTARFNHPNIVAVHAVGEHGGTPYVALEYVEGQDLGSRIADGPLSWQEATRIVLAVAEALREAHARGILHRDLKPENVVIALDGRVRVLDFGLAAWLTSDEGLDDAPTGEENPVPSPGARGPEGTPAYMAPEQWKGLECGPAADIWAAGAVLFELCVDELPFPGDTAEQISRDVVGPVAAPRLDTLAPAPRELADLVARCLAKKPVERPSAAELQDELASILRVGRERTGPELSPFRGLLPFTEDDAAHFFGRDAEIAMFVERIRLEPVLPVVGPSGAGKTSFVCAGVIPRLVEQERWEIVQLRPGARPFSTLAHRLRHAGKLRARGTGDPGEEKRLALRLAEHPAELALHLRSIADVEGCKVMLVVDQLEELFTLTDDETLRARFMQAIWTAADDALEPVRVVITVRDDFLGRLATGPEARHALRAVTVLGRPTEEMLLSALVSPLAAVGYAYEDQELPAVMAHAVVREPAALPLLQFAAHKLWEQRDVPRRLLLRSAYQAMGGVEGALATHGDGVLDGMTPDDLAVARELLLRLVTPEGTRKVVTRAQALEGLPAEAEQVLGRLVDARLCTLRRAERRAEHGSPEVELAHESLAVGWKRLARFIDESRDDLAFLAEVGQQAELWDRRGRSPDGLLRGDALGQALRAAARAKAVLPELVRLFVRASGRREALRRLQRRAALGAVLGVLAVASLILAWQKREVEQRRVEAVEQRAIAQEQRAAALIEGARGALAHGDLLEARAKLRAAFEATDSIAARALFWQLAREPLAWQRALSVAARSASLSPDGERLVFGADDGLVRLLDARTGEDLRVLATHADQVMSVAFAPDGQHVASVGFDGKVLLSQMSSGAPPIVLSADVGRAMSVAFHPAGKLLAVAGRDTRVRLFATDPSAPEDRTLRSDGTATFRSVDFSADGELIVGAATDGRAYVWRLDGTRAPGPAPQPERLNIARFSPDGRWLAVGAAGGQLQLWRTGHWTEPSVVLRGHDDTVHDVQFSRDGKLLVSTSLDRTVRLWAIPSGEPLSVLRGHTSNVFSASLRADAAMVVTAGFDRTLRAWMLTGGEDPERGRGHLDRVAAVDISPDGTTMASASVDATVRLWDVASGKQLRVMEGHVGEVWDVAFSPDGSRLASAGSDDTLRLWDAQTGTTQTVLAGHGDDINAVFWSPDGKALVSAGYDATIRFWDPDAGILQRVLRGHEGPVFRAHIDPSGHRLLSGSSDNTMRVWDLDRGSTEKVLSDHHDIVRDVRFSADGLLAASASYDGRALIFDALTFEQKASLQHPSRVLAVSFDPSGQHVITGCADGSLRSWSSDGHLERTLRGHRGAVNMTRVTRDGSLLASASFDGTARLWELPSGRPHWRAPLLMSSPVRLLSHEGWAVLTPGGRAREAPEPLPAALRELLETRARTASVATAGDEHVCVHTHDDDALLFEGGKVRYAGHHEQLRQVLAVGGGCVIQTAADVLLLSNGAEPRRLDVEGPVAIATGRDAIHVATANGVVSFAASGEQTSEHPAEAGIAAIAPDGEGLLLAYRGGQIALVPASGPTRSIHLQQAPSSQPLSLVRAPADTLVVGYTDGHLGLWDLRDGKVLVTTHLHGAVEHLLLEHDTIYAATDLGDSRAWDLGVLQIDRCELLRALWQQIPVVWEAEGLRFKGPDPGHPCAVAE